jgi:TonB family protein
MMLACVADVALRRAPAALRHLMWCLTLVSALLLPVGGLYVPRIAGQAFVIHTNAAAGVLLDTPNKFKWIIAVYLTGVAILLLRLALDILAANRLVRESKPSSLPGVLVSDHATVPFAWGSIVVPAGYENWAAVVAHERAHIERWDVWTAVVARIACAIYWFHPLVWWAASRMRLEADRACDDSVLRDGFGDTGYAENLVQIAKSFGRSELAPGLLDRSQLELRVRHILSAGVDRRRLSAAALCLGVLASIAVVAPLAALSREDVKIYRLTKDMTPPKVLFKVDPEYTAHAKAAKLRGTVLLAVVVGSDGKAHDIQVLRSLDSGLDAQAVAAIRKWKFQPGMKENAAVNTRATIEVNFRLL